MKTATQKTTTIKATYTKSIAAALLSAGYKSDDRGGDGRYSEFGWKLGNLGSNPRTALAIMVWRADGAALTAADKRVIRATIAA